MLSSPIKLETIKIVELSVNDFTDDDEYSDDIWDWLWDSATFSRKDKPEYMVSLPNKKVDSLKDLLCRKSDYKFPDLLLPFFTQAYKMGCSYILFYKG